MNQQDILAAARRLHDRVNFRGLPISVENRKGSIRQGVAKSGKRWQTFIRTPYGYLRGTEGVDGDHVDVFVGPNLDAPNVYVVHTRNLETGGYDEDKCMLGFMTADDAKYDFLKNYDNPKFFGSMTVVPFEQFRKNVLGGEYKGKKILAEGLSIGDEVVVNGIQYRMVVKGFRGKLVLLESKGQFNRYQPKTILRTMGQITKI